MEKQKCPAVRFNGFSYEWQKKEFKEIFNYERPDNYIVKSTEYLDSKKTPVLTANKGFILGYTDEIETYNKPCIIFDDFTLDSKYVDFSFMVKSSALKILTVQDAEADDLYYSYYLLKQAKIEIMGHARHYIGIVQPTKINVAFFTEQQEISNFFQKLDRSIALHEKKLAQTQNLKKAMLEKMFPTAESNKQPEIRLKGFSGEWEEFQLENLGEFKNGMNMDKDSMGFGNPFVNIQHIFESTEVTKHNLELVNATNKQKKDYNLLKGDVLFVRSSVKLEGVGDTAVLVDDIEGATYSGFLIRFRSNINLSLDYKKVMFSIPLVRKQILANATTSANTNINQESLKKILILLPKYEEQTQIGLFFKQLDETLVLQQQQLQTLKNLKQAFLEKMFV